MWFEAHAGEAAIEDPIDPKSPATARGLLGVVTIHGRGVRSGAAKRDEVFRSIQIAPRPRSLETKARPLIDALGIENLQDADVSFVIAFAGEVQVVARGILGAPLRIQLLGAAIESLQGIGDLRTRSAPSARSSWR